MKSRSSCAGAASTRKFLLALLLAAAALPLQAGNWPAWRGPTGDGVCTEKNLPMKWGRAENVKWRVPLPERGNSTPIVWNDRIFVTQPAGDRRTVLCLNRADGKLLWQQGVPTKEKEPTHGTNPYCSASPVTDGERVIVSFASDGLFCYDLNGKEQWRRTDLGRQIHIWGNGASPVILTGTRDNRLKMGRELGADHVVNVKNEDPVEAVRRLNGGKGVDYVVECSGAPNAVNEAARMVNRGGKICLAAFPHEQVPVDIAHIVRNNIYLFGIRGEGKSATHRAEAFMSQKRFDATKIHTHTFALEDLPTAIRYARERIDDAIKVVVKARGVAAHKVAAE